MAVPASMRLGVRASPTTITAGLASQLMEAIPITWAGPASLLLVGPVVGSLEEATASMRSGDRGAMESTPGAAAAVRLPACSGAMYLLRALQMDRLRSGSGAGTSVIEGSLDGRFFAGTVGMVESAVVV